MTQVKYKDILDSFTESFPLLEKVYEVYNNSPVISEDQENTLRRSIEVTTLEMLELIVIASRQSVENKKDTLRQARTKLDTLKVFIDLAGQSGYVNESDVQAMLDSVENVSKMIGGWRKQLYKDKDEKKSD
jgi:hypothetical protein